MSAGTAPDGAGRVVIETVWPEIDGGRTPVKRIVGDSIEVWADIFSDGHDRLGAAILYRAADEADWWRAPMALFDNDRWSGRFTVDRNTRYLFTIEAWRDSYASWRDEIAKKHAAGQDIRTELDEGMALALEARDRAAGADAAQLAEFVARLQELADIDARLALLSAAPAAHLVGAHAHRENLSRYDRTLEIIVDRPAARFSAWYELFPRSAANDPGRHGTFKDVIARLPYVQEMGFDVLYFPPIHPIGTVNRKGRNNALEAAPDDPGSPYAIGSAAGGHDAVHPQLGTLADFRRLVAAARRHGLELALDFAVHCAPDHPWVRQHPEWFRWRPDGTIRFAENPPKKYEDIVNVEFYGAALPDLWYALRDVVLFWVENGVDIFRVDNPHTKPIPFWQWLIREVNARHPQVIFLAEAFTRPKMMRKLAKVGYQQSYTYFTWRNTKAELIDYVTELAGAMGEYYRPNFFTNTPDINPYYLQTSGRAGFVVRAALAATLSSAWGIYGGFELCEAEPLPGREEYADSEKYELRRRDFDQPGNIRAFIAALNRIRRDNPALHDFRNTLFLEAGDDSILAYWRATPAGDNCLLILVNVDPHHRHECDFEVPLWQFGLGDDETVAVEDLLAGHRFTLTGKWQHIALDPQDRSVVIWRVGRPAA